MNQIKVALVTGASSGIGLCASQLLRQSGFEVYAAARRMDRMAALQAEGIHTLSLDVTNDESMRSCIATIIAKHGRIDVLVNNAGYGSYGSLEDVPLSEARNQFEINVFGLARMTQLALPHMRAQHSGRIINITSIAGKIYEPMGSWYHSTKFAVEGLSDCLRMELKPFGIDVSIIEPGLIKTEWGGIAVEKLLSTSGGTAYHELAKKGATLLTNMEKNASDPMVIAKLILKAATARKPKIRYVGGYNARFGLFMRAILPDRMYDAVMMFVFNRGKV